PMMSVGPAGANGTTSRTVRSGYLSWARTSDGAASAPAPTANRWRRLILVSSLTALLQRFIEQFDHGAPRAPVAGFVVVEPLHAARIGRRVGETSAGAPLQLQAPVEAGSVHLVLEGGTRLGRECRMLGAGAGR